MESPRTSQAPDPLCDPRTAYDTFAATAAALDEWHAGGRRGPRPPGRLRTYRPPTLSRTTKALCTPLHRLLVDPDGRPFMLRRRNEY
ncbi:hypothetical protein OHT76_27315 [Streptomyces sp. NBC_00287]|uniref:hypothetical protein n=1 Tax=Streptomyces sp. NBC_00287 TaxID=2975702 RepID=UPI002E2B45CF|nr:hypothetical protein [Streptomyces sp. NBC_00287]